MGHAVHVHAHALGQLHALVGIADAGHEVRAGDVLHRVGHGDALPGGCQVDVVTQPLHMVGTQDLLGGTGEDALQDIHHAVQVRVRLVQLTGSELGVVLGVHALVAEDTAHLVHTLKAAHDQPLQVQLGGDTHIHIDILRVVVGDKGPGVGAAGDGAEDGRLHLHKAQTVQIAAQERHEPAADLEVPLALRVHDQIHIPLAVADLLVGQAVELLRQGPQGLAQQRDVVCTDGHLAPLGAEHLALDAHDVADIVLLKVVIVVLVHLVLTGVDLDTAGLVLQVAERHLAHTALAHQAACHGHSLPLHGVKVILDILCVVGHIKPGNSERVAALVLQSLQLVAADAQQLAHVLGLGLFVHVAVGLVCHNAASFVYPYRRCRRCLSFNTVDTVVDHALGRLHGHFIARLAAHQRLAKG